MNEPEPEAEATKPSAPKLPLLLFSAKATADHPGLATPPHQSALAVPFRWEEQPGKPRPSLALAAPLLPAGSETAPRSLELPPRLAPLGAGAKLPSPTTVLDGPYAAGGRRARSASFRAGGAEPSRAERGALVVPTMSRGGFKVKSWFGSWRRSRGLAFSGSGGNNRDISGGSYVFPDSGDLRDSDGNGNGSVKMARITRAGSFSTFTRPRSHFWGTIYEGLKQVVPWKTKKLKKGI